MDKLNITIVGIGYVGMSLSVLLSQEHNVVAHDIDEKKVLKVNNKESTCADIDIENYLKEKELSLFATLDSKEAFADAQIIIIATPTDYNTDTNYFNTSSVDSVVDSALKFNNNALIVIKSTIPVGHTENLRKKFNTNRIIFSPEFLREGQALKDNLYPSRIIVGGYDEQGMHFANILLKASLKNDTTLLFMSPTEAEATKLFSNTYLAMRVAFFNELDTYAISKNLDSKDIINGVCLDERIGSKYNNPSFGYGGYCLPKDTKQLLSNYDKVPQNLIKAIVTSNETRKDFIANDIIKNKPKTVGIFRLVMKGASDNYRSSAIQEIIKIILDKNISVIIYEPLCNENFFIGCEVINNLNNFKLQSDIIVANRMSNEISDFSNKIYSRDIFNEN